MLDRLTEDGWLAVRRPIGEYLDHLRELLTLEELAEAGIVSLASQSDLVRALVVFDSFESGTPDPDPAVVDEHPRVVRAAEIAKLAKDEVAADFALLHAQMVVSVWGALETMVDDLVVACFVQEPRTLESPDVQKVKVPMATFQELDGEGRMRWLVDAIKPNLPRRMGVGSAELLLGWSTWPGR